MVFFPQVSTPQPYIRLSCTPIRAKCPAHLILLDLITRTILDEECRSLSSLLCSILHSPVTSPLLGPKMLMTYTEMLFFRYCMKWDTSLHLYSIVLCLPYVWCFVLSVRIIMIITTFQSQVQVTGNIVSYSAKILQ